MITRLRFIFILLFPAQIFAQKLDLVPFGGIAFKSTLKANDYNTVIRPAIIYGGTLNFKVDKFNFGFTATNINTTAKIISLYDRSYESVSFMVSNLTLSGINNYKISDDLTAFYGVEIGLINFRNVNTQTNNLKGSIAIKGGLAYALNDRISLRLQPQLLSTLDGIGLGVGFGSGGLSFSTGSYSNYAQFSLTGGIIITLYKPSK